MIIDPSVIAVYVPLAVALLAVVSSWMNRTKLNNLHIELNSRLSQLIEARSEAARADGLAAGGMQSQAIQAAVELALAKALAMPTEVPGLAAAIARNQDTNDRVRAMERPAPVPTATEISLTVS